ncbi:MAG: alpha-glucan family phosphorylase [Nitrospirae bacterium]|nr:MAG: alpha-glucan family phosphorylase [Nitrospirota bacterium]
MNTYNYSITSSYFFQRPLPPGLEGLYELALDLRWTWSHTSDRLWQRLDPEAWERTGNPYFILQSVAQARLEEAASDETVKTELQTWLRDRQAYLEDPGWFGQTVKEDALHDIAYFSMEFGLREALPIYSGGLGILAGDHLKAASDLGVPLIGVGLLYQQGYFRQRLNAEGWQVEAFPYNDPITLPLLPARDPQGGWLRVKLEFPGRTVLVRVWQARVGKVALYLLDTNDPLNSPHDRSITANLYPHSKEQRLMQELVLGIGGWRALEASGYRLEVCHINEGHAAFALLARAASFMAKAKVSFPEAMWATRAGNLFTTHTPVDAAFDRYDASLLRPFAQVLAEHLDISLDHLLGLGRRNPRDPDEPFNMAYLAMRGSGWVNAVSRLHGQVSRHIFLPLYPRWPKSEIPVSHITNGVHVPTWDSAEADALWTCHCGKKRWSGQVEQLCDLIAQVPDEELWKLRIDQRLALIHFVRRRLVRQLQEHGASADLIRSAQHALDPNALTLGFARRFTAYKRPTLLLAYPDRLIRMLMDRQRPVQLLMAGKAHPHDEEGKRLVQTLARFAAREDLRDRVVFLEDYEMNLAQQMLSGVDVWLNTPRRPLEASGTSGMKVLVNGGLNCSTLDGWWDEAYTPDVGWAFGRRTLEPHPEYDPWDAEELYDHLERSIIPEFYDRDANGIPRQWVARMRASMATLTPRYSSNRMVRQYVEQAYLPCAAAFRKRTAQEGSLAKALHHWHEFLREHWQELRFGQLKVERLEQGWALEVDVYHGEIDPSMITVELYADGLDGEEPVRRPMKQVRTLPGLFKTNVYRVELPETESPDRYTPRILPSHPQVSIPLETQFILWQR